MDKGRYIKKMVYKQDKTEYGQKKYKQLKHKIQRLCRKTKSDCINGKCEEIEKLEMTHNSQFHKKIKEMLPKRHMNMWIDDIKMLWMLFSVHTDLLHLPDAIFPSTLSYYVCFCCFFCVLCYFLNILLHWWLQCLQLLIKCCVLITVPLTMTIKF